MTFLGALRRAGQGGKRTAFVLAVALAFLLQSFLAVTHVHVPGTASNTIAASHDAAQKQAPRRAPADPATNCPVCHAVAQSGHYLAPTEATFIPAVAATAWLFAAVYRASVATRPSHAWRSRAPPE